MDLTKLTLEFLELKKETVINIAKKAVLPLTFIPVIWIIFIRRSSLPDGKKVKVKKSFKEQDENGDAEYSLQNLVSLHGLQTA